MYAKKNLQGDPDSEFTGAPPIPVIPDIHKRVYEAVTATPAALDMSSWHRCDTTHCRGGWVVTLAGESGRKLEQFHNTALAAQLIYRASDPQNPVSPVRFYDDNETALADMKRLAEIGHDAAAEDPANAIV